MNDNICPNCDIEMDLTHVNERTMILCGICSFGWYVDKSENNDYSQFSKKLTSAEDILKCALNINSYSILYTNNNVILFSVKNNDLWRVFDNGGEIAIDKPNTDYLANVPLNHKGELLPPVELAKRVEEVVSGIPINFDRFKSFTRDDIDILWTVNTPL